MATQNIMDRTVVRMLACLDQKQRKGFREYLSCKLFNTNETLSVLYQYLEAKALKPKPDFLSQEKLLKSTAISPSMLDKNFSNLLTLLNNFVTLWATQSDPPRENAITFQAWFDMGLPDDLLERKYKKMKRKRAQTARDEMDIFHALRLETVYAQFKINQPRKSQAGLFAPHHQLLESYYLVSKLKYLCATLSVKTVFQDDVNDRMEALSAKQVANLPAIGQAYYQAYQLLRSTAPDLPTAQDFFALLQNDGRYFSPADRSDLFASLLNSSFSMASNGDPGFENLLYHIYKEMLEQGLLLRGDGCISGANFKNVVSIKSRVGALQEAEEFIAHNQHLLPEADRQIVVPYATGLVLFYREQYPEAIQKFRFLLENAPEDMFLGLNARSMLWKSYFEFYNELSMDEHAEMHNLYHSFRQFVNRNTRMPESRKLGYLNFIRVFKRLINIDDKSWQAPTTSELVALREEVAAMEEIVNKRWVLATIGRRITQKEN